MASEYANEDAHFFRTYVGIDPGTHTGVVLLEEEPGGMLSCRHAVTIHRPAATLTRPRTLAELEQARMLALFLQTYTPHVCVIEEPWDVSDGWGKGGRRIGTGFRIGAAWAFAVGAVPPGVEMVTYPVRGNGKEPGWMGRGKKEGVMLRVEVAWRENVTGRDWESLGDHERAAAGVLLHHLGKLPSPMGRKQETKRLKAARGDTWEDTRARCS